MKQTSFFKTALTDLVEIFTEEIKHVFKDSGVVVIFFVASLLYPILYGYIYRNEVLRDIPVAVVNLSNSALSRELVRKIDATPDLKVAYKVRSMSEAKVLFAKNEVHGIVYIPSSFSSELSRGKQTHVFAYSNTATLLYFRGVYSAVNFVCLDMDENIQVANLEAKGLTEHQAKATTTPILRQGHAMYNSKSGFASFLLPGALILMLQQTLVIGIGMLAGTAREENKFHQLIPYQRKYHGTLRIVTGKALAYFVLYLFIGIYNLVLIPYLFQLPNFFTIWTALQFLVPFLLATVFFGMGISVFFWVRETSLLIYLCTSIPLLIMAGFSWPASNVPVFWKMISYFFPSTFGIQGFLKMNSMGASLSQIDFECMGLCIQAGIYFIFTCFVYRWQIKQSEKKRVKTFSTYDR